MNTKPLRFGAVLCTRGSVADLIDQARHAADSGCDVVLLPDHLGYSAPLPSLVAVAAAVPSVRVGSCVLNCGLYRPALLARDLAAVDSAIDGRLEIGLGAGYVAEEFETAGLRFPTPAERVHLVGEHVEQIRATFANPDYSPTPIQHAPPIMIGGTGDKMLAMAATHADIVSILTFGTESELLQRVQYVKEHAGARLDQIELSFSFGQVAIDDPNDLLILKRAAPEMPESQLRSMATCLDGPIEAAAERISRMRQELGIGYFTFSVGEGRGLSWPTLEKLIARVKG
ncbi:TIGR03621 family F420-dependent LLM class oxidoreductase [Mycobacterium montefiorense]|uniref:TIGR03621 family F420-dependent LLM class oxidoreductase n=1 Tax=Mycobacterium montefiorense TaxID=154654 RepID=UPI0021DCA3AE|nr:TIGR03621 family F420-dependent LLM class oxidoreductase [Mycobacterium montefiorense]MCV7425130.1 TIGR03621 family F420-dependent LLM class oxidoreductase [Mycobacterium montefiorense]GLE50729.1 LLM class F420-dependent oxidoreductase [Mycobacterium montefiorense]